MSYAQKEVPSLPVRFLVDILVWFSWLQEKHAANDLQRAVLTAVEMQGFFKRLPSSLEW
jgi:hypothetical protein